MKRLRRCCEVLLDDLEGLLLCVGVLGGCVGVTSGQSPGTPDTPPDCLHDTPGEGALGHVAEPVDVLRVVRVGPEDLPELPGVDIELLTEEGHDVRVVGVENHRISDGAVGERTEETGQSGDAAGNEVPGCELGDP